MHTENLIQCQFTTKPSREMHFHQNIEVLYVLEGKVRVNYENSTKELNTDDFIVINTNVRHNYEADEEVLLGIVFINYARLVEMFHGEQVYFLCNSAEEKSESYDKMRHYIRQIFNYFHTNEGQGVILQNSVAYQLLYVLTSEFIVKKGMSQYDSLRGISDERMNEILNYLMNHYQEQITLQGLADKLYLSNAYLSKYIKKNFGMSFLKLLNNIRMEHAVSELLYSEKTVVRIAMDNGFSNLAGFNRTFREIYNMTPAEYRKDMEKKTESAEKEEPDKEILKKVESYLTSNAVPVHLSRNIAMATVEADAAEAQGYEQNWNQLINAGTAADLLRYDCREQIRYLRKKLNFRYIRFWNVFSDEMMIQMGENKTSYNFSLLDKVFDFIMEIEAKPFIELGFKTKEIYDNILHKIVGNDNGGKFSIFEKNKGFLIEFVKHLVKRYGVTEVETWYVELEKNSVVKPNVKPEEYAKAFEGLEEIFKSFAPDIQVGGAGLCLNYLGSEFRKVIHSWKKIGFQPDFLSIYSYPYIMNEDLLEAGRNSYSSDESYLYNQIQEVKAICREYEYEVPKLFVTEWSSTLSNRNPLNDCCFKSGYIMKNLIQNTNEADMIGYWVATDLFSEYYDTTRILFGGCGLITHDLIRKPAYYAFSFLNSLGNQLIARNRNAIITCDDNQKYSICCHNYKHFNFRFYLQEENEIAFERTQSIYEDNESLQMNFKIYHVNNGTYQLKKYAVNMEHGDIQTEWGKIGYYDDLSQKEIDYYKAITQPDMYIEMIEVKNHTLEIETSMLAQEIQNIVITQQ